MILKAPTSALLKHLWLAHIQLIRFFGFLEGILRQEREDCRTYRRRYYRNTSVAINIYVSVRNDIANRNRLRSELKERKRSGRRWTELAARTSPVFCLSISRHGRKDYICIPSPISMNKGFQKHKHNNPKNSGNQYPSYMSTTTHQYIHSP